MARTHSSFFMAALAGAAIFSATTLAGTASASTVYDINSGAISLDQLIGTGSTLVVGDKVFSNFSYSTTGADMPDASDVNITGKIVVEGSTTLWGFNIQGGFQDTNTAGASDALLRYTVSVTDPAVSLITGMTLIGDPDVIGTGKVHLTETWSPNSGNQKLRIYDIEPGFATQLRDSIIFDTPVATLNVTKDILASIPDGLPGNAASLTSIDQLYSQTPTSGSGVPEPASLSLLAIGAMGLLARRRR